MKGNNTIPDYPAFPTTDDYAHSGITKREYFAISAMQGILASGEYYTSVRKIIASEAVHLADALIDELNKQDGLQENG